MARRPTPIVLQGQPRETAGQALGGLGELLGAIAQIKQQQQAFGQGEELGLTPEESKLVGIEGIKKLTLLDIAGRREGEERERKSEAITDILTTIGGQKLPEGVSAEEFQRTPELIRRPEEKATPTDIRGAAGQAITEGVSLTELKSLKGLEDIFTGTKKDRKIIKDITGRQRFTDTGELVFPDITEEEITAAKKKESLFQATKRTEELSLAKFKKPFRDLTQEQQSDVLTDRERSVTQSLTTSLRKEFEQLPEVKQFKILKPQFLKIEALGDKFKLNPNVNRAFIDQAMIVIFNKMIDPASVVRESEFARTPEFIPLANRIEAALPKLLRGGAGMTDADRLQLIDDAKTLFKVHADEFNRTIEERTELATRLGVIPEGAVPAKTFELKQFREGQTATDNEGNKIIFRNGKWQIL